MHLQEKICMSMNLARTFILRCFPNVFVPLFPQCVCYVVYQMCLLRCLPNVFVTLFPQCVCYVVDQTCLLRCLPNVFVTLFTRCVCFHRYMLKNASSLFSLADYGIAPPEYHRKAIWLVWSEHFILLTEGCGNSSRQCIAKLVERVADKAKWTQTLDNSRFNNNCTCVNELCSHYWTFSSSVAGPRDVCKGIAGKIIGMETLENTSLEINCVRQWIVNSMCQWIVPLLFCHRHPVLPPPNPSSFLSRSILILVFSTYNC